ncbi:MAG: YhcH/YjgK/YiaL family protein [Lentisphaeria bacterium]|nr:YhcH/YjgK/YiaL family protein [Lentisphaeria bacterium]
MIYDRLENLPQYAGLNPAIFDRIGEFLKTVTPQTEAGRHILVPEQLFADVLYYNTKPLEECKVEVHERFIDVQVILEGSETIAGLSAAGLELADKNAERDYELYAYRAGNPEVQFPVQAGEFAVFFPGEGHLTGLNPARAAIRKIVFKIDKSLIRK